MPDIKSGKDDKIRIKGQKMLGVYDSAPRIKALSKSPVFVRSEKQKKVDEIMKNCIKLSYKMNVNLNQLKVQMDQQNQLNDSFGKKPFVYNNLLLDKILTTLKDLEGIDSKVIGTIYNYRKLDNLETQEESKGVLQEYKSGVMDPSRIVAKMEKSSKYSRKRNIIV